jgi:hypothetical protein
MYKYLLAAALVARVNIVHLLVFLMKAQWVRHEVRTESMYVVQSTLVYMIILLLALLPQPPPCAFCAPTFWVPAFPDHRLLLAAVTPISFNQFCKDLVMNPTGFDPMIDLTDRPTFARNLTLTSFQRLYFVWLC